MFEDIFIAIYTHECKSYCDKEFFENLFTSDIGNASVAVIDNSINMDYFNKLQNEYGKRAYIDHIVVDRNDTRTQFLRNIEASLYGLRRKFLDGPYLYFIILESDVLPPQDWLHSFMGVIDQADIIGGLYYWGWHSPDMWEGEPRLISATHVLSGCTLYKREILERFIFRWDKNNPNAFPDAYMSYDAGHAGYRRANYTKIQCKHLADKEGGRGIDKIN